MLQHKKKNQDNELGFGSTWIEKDPGQQAVAHHPNWKAYTMQQKPRWQDAIHCHGFKGYNKKQTKTMSAICHLGFRSS